MTNKGREEEDSLLSDLTSEVDEEPSPVPVKSEEERQDDLESGESEVDQFLMVNSDGEEEYGEEEDLNQPESDDNNGVLKFFEDQAEEGEVEMDDANEEYGEEEVNHDEHIELYNEENPKYCSTEYITHEVQK